MILIDYHSQVQTGSEIYRAIFHCNNWIISIQVLLNYSMQLVSHNL